MATSYTNPGGSGDRTSTIVISKSSFTISGGSLDNFIDGEFDSDSSDAWWAFISPVTDNWIEFDFGLPVKIDEAKYYQSNATEQGTWKWQGWDGDSWVDIGGTFTLGGTTTQTITTLAGNTAFYTKYRLYGVSGIFFTSPWVTEIEFKIEQFSLNVSFDDDAKTRVSLRSFVVPDTTLITTPGADTFEIPVYDQLIVEIWGGGASGAAYKIGHPAGADLGSDGQDTSATVQGFSLFAGGGKRSSFWQEGNEFIMKTFTPGGAGGTTSGAGTGFQGERGEDGRFGTKQSGSGFGSRGGNAPFGGTGGQRGAGDGVGYGGFAVTGEDGQAPGGGGGSAGIGGQAGPPIGADYTYNRAMGAGGAGGYRRIVFNYMDIGSPEPGDIISFNIGAGGAGPSGDSYGGYDLDGGNGGNGGIRISVGLVPPPPPPDGGQGTATINYARLRVGDVLTAHYNDDDPDGGETDFAWQWYRGGVPIDGGTGETYQLQPADVGAYISVGVFYTDAIGYTVEVVTDAVGPILPEARPLDDLLDNLFSCYSNRLLVGSYTGPLIRMRASTTTIADWGWQQSGTPTVDSSTYIRFDFGTPRLVTECIIKQNTYTTTDGQGTFQWRGSNDAASWTNIGSPFVLNPTNGINVQTELNGNTTPYRYYELRGVSGVWANHLIWEAEFKIDDGGFDSKVFAANGQSYHNPGGEGPRSTDIGLPNYCHITVTTSFAASGIQKIVSGKYPDAGQCFWPDYASGELDFEEISAWKDYVSPLFAGSSFYSYYDQSGRGHHLDTINTIGQLPLGWDNDGDLFTVPNGRWAAQSSANRNFRRSAMPSPQNALYFLEAIQRDNDRPIRDFNWAYGTGEVIAFEHPTSTEEDWAEDNAVLFGDGRASGQTPRAVTSSTFPTSDDDVVVWEGALGTSRVAILHNGTQQPLSVSSKGYTNKAGTATFSWLLEESDTNRDIRLCELVFWEADVGITKPVELALYRTDVMLTWLDEMPEPSLAITFEDGAELTVDFTPPVAPLELEVTFNDDAWMSVILEGFEPEFGVEFFDDATMSVTFSTETPVPLPLQIISIITGF